MDISSTLGRIIEWLQYILSSTPDDIIGIHEILQKRLFAQVF